MKNLFKNILIVICFLLGCICYLGLFSVGAFIEWGFIKESFWQFFNPFILILVAIKMIQMPITYILIGSGILSYVGLNKLTEQTENCENNLKEDEIRIEYNRNPFIPKGRMKRFDYIIYTVLLNLLNRLLEYMGYVVSPQIWGYITLLSSVLVIVLNMFIVRNRIYDITLSNKKAWLYTLLLFFIVVIVFMLAKTNDVFVCVLLPFSIALMVIPSKIEKEDDIKNIKVKEQSAFDIAREIHKKEK